MRPFLPDEKISSGIREQMACEVEDYGGGELLWWCREDEDGVIIEAEVCASGNENSVAALFPQMEKGDVVIHNHPGGDLTPSEADVSVSSFLGNEGIGFYITDNAISKIKIIVPPVSRKKREKLDHDYLAGFLNEGGALSRFSRNFEPRKEQIKLLRLIATAFDEERLMIGEAGTGVGKSFAYLIPALHWAKANKERVVISTATINLQQQLMEKDIPAVKKFAKIEVKVVLVKGRSNYLCLRRLGEANKENDLFKEDLPALTTIREWAETTGDGSLSDLSFKPSDNLWSTVNSDGDICTGVACKFHEDCFFIRARREAAAAEILVANHHILFADLAVKSEGKGFDKSAVLPPYRHLVLDEAHNMENNATSYFSRTLSRYHIQRLAGRLYRKKGQRERGIWTAIRNLLTAESLPPVESAIKDLVTQWDFLERSSQRLLVEESSLRISGAPDKNMEDFLLKPMKTLLKALHKLGGLCHDVQMIVEKVIEEASGEGGKERATLREWVRLKRRLEEYCDFCLLFLAYGEREDMVFWIERRKKGETVSYRYIISPLEIGPVLHEALFEPMNVVVMTSATLTIRDSFSYWGDRIGLTASDDGRLLYGLFPSPFNYPSHALFAIPTDGLLPDDPHYNDDIIERTRETLLLSEGRGLVLFTSYAMLNYVYESLLPSLREAQIPVYRQGDDENGRLLQKFRDETKSVLFATDSFWEGVDAPGETLSVVILCRLPFRPPSEPITIARAEAIEKRGLNSFYDYTLPEAVMRFKQGFGRLIRSNEDSGIVLLLDRRAVVKRYGSLFLSSVPPATRCVKRFDDLLRNMEDFFWG